MIATTDATSARRRAGATATARPTTSSRTRGRTLAARSSQRTASCAFDSESDSTRVTVAFTSGMLEARVKLAVDEALLHPGHDLAEVEGDRPVVARHDAVALAGEHRYDLCVGGPVGLLPQVGEGLGGEERPHLVVHEALDLVGDRHRQGGHHVGHAPLGEGLERVVRQGLDVDAGHEAGGDDVGQSPSQGRVLGQGRDGRGVLVGVEHLVAGVAGHQRDRRDHRRQEDQERGHRPAQPPHAPPAGGRPRRGGAVAGPLPHLGTQFGHLGPKALQLVMFRVVERHGADRPFSVRVVGLAAATSTAP